MSRIRTTASIVLATGFTFGALAVVPARTDVAIAELAKRVADSPGDVALHNDYGNLLQLADRPFEAEAEYRRALELDPSFLTARINLAMVLQETHRDREARRELERVLDVDPNRAWAHYQLGMLAERKGRRRSAIKSYAQAFRLDPRLTFLKNNPQLVDNRLLTESLLAAYQDVSSASEAPRGFADAAGVAQIVATAIRDDIEQKSAAAATAAKPTESSAGGLTQILGPSAGGTEEASRVLDPASLDPGSRTGQATPAPSPGRRPGPTPVTGGAILGGNPARPDAGSRGGFRPGRLSTSWLDTERVRGVVETRSPA